MTLSLAALPGTAGYAPDRRPRGLRGRRLGLGAATALTLLGAHARADESLPTELEGIGIVERPGAVAPKDLAFVDQDGRSVKLGDYFDGKVPVVLVLAYYQCPMLCTLVLNGLTDGLKSLAWNAGDKYRVVTISIDPRDTTALAQKKRAAYLRSYGRDGTGTEPRQWDFLIGAPGPNGQALDAPSSVARLADAIGFTYRWEKETEQFAHAAGAFVFTPDGRLSRTLYGIEFKEKNLRLALLEATEGKLGSAWDKILLFCYHYDPSAKSYVVAAVRVMRFGGLLTVLLLAYWLRRLWRSDSMANSTVSPTTPSNPRKAAPGAEHLAPTRTS